MDTVEYLISQMKHHSVGGILRYATLGPLNGDISEHMAFILDPDDEDGRDDMEYLLEDLEELFGLPGDKRYGEVILETVEGGEEGYPLYKAFIRPYSVDPNNQRNYDNSVLGDMEYILKNQDSLILLTCSEGP